MQWDSCAKRDDSRSSDRRPSDAISNNRVSKGALFLEEGWDNRPDKGWDAPVNQVVGVSTWDQGLYDWKENVRIVGEELVTLLIA